MDHGVGVSLLPRLVALFKTFEFTFSLSQKTNSALLAIILGDYVDFLLIFGLLTVNAAIGFFEEHSAGNAMAALKRQLSLMALCLRDGEWREVPASDVVPGDIIRLNLGGIVPADAKVLEADKRSSEMQVDESSLTGMSSLIPDFQFSLTLILPFSCVGEPLPVSKYPGSIIYAGSPVKMGEMDAVVFATGKHTAFGQAASVVALTESHVRQPIGFSPPPTEKYEWQSNNLLLLLLPPQQGHFQDVLKNIGLFCIVFITICVALELIIQFPVRQKPCTGLSWGMCLGFLFVCVC